MWYRPWFCLYNRVKTGVGYPQLSTIIECSDAAHGLGGHIISDGGCTVAGDIAKAFGGGADFVMLGGMLAGHDEGGGEIVDNKVQFDGMSSRTANEKILVDWLELLRARQLKFHTEEK